MNQPYREAAADPRPIKEQRINPDNIRPEDLKALGKYIHVDRTMITEIKVGNESGGESTLIVPKSATPKTELRNFFSRVISVGPEVTVKCACGGSVVPGCFVVYGNSMGFPMDSFQDIKIVHELNILGVVRDIPNGEISDNILLWEKLLDRRLSIREHQEALEKYKTTGALPGASKA